MTSPDAWSPPVAGGARGRLSIVMVSALIAAGAMVVLSIVMLSVYRVMTIPSAAMEPTLPTGSAMAVNRLDRSPHDGDIVVFGQRSSLTGGSVSYVKRVLGVPGDTVGCCTRGAVTRNGTVLAEPYTMPGDTESVFPAVTVPAGRLWVMGDHRADSADSRFHISDADHGTVAQSDLKGTVAFHGSLAAVYAWLLGRAAVGAVSLGAVAGLVLTLIRHR